MMYCLNLFLLLLTVILIFAFFTILKNSNLNKDVSQEEISLKISSFPINHDDKTSQLQYPRVGSRSDQGNLALSLLLEILPSSPSERDTLLYKNENDFDGGPSESSGSGQQEKKKRKKRARKKRPGSIEEERKENQELVCSYPFSKCSSTTQRKIKQQYDQLVKSHGSNGLTVDQVRRFVNCLVEARNDL